MQKKRRAVSILIADCVKVICISVCVFLLTGCCEDPLEIHKNILTIDTHVDTPFYMYVVNSEFDLGERHDPYESGSKIDFPRMKDGGLDAVFFAVFVWQGERTPEGNASAKEKALDMFEIIHENLEKHSTIAAFASTAEDAYRIEKEGKRAVFMGMENGYPIGNDLSLIEEYYNLGARYITLCWSKNNDICDSSTDAEGSEHTGLSEFGEKVVSEMNRVGMIVDVSHVSDEDFYDVMERSTASVIASHSCARAICDHPRNLDDAMLKKLAEKDGVIQVTLYPDFVKTPDPNDPEKLPTVADVVDHIDHIVEVAGIDHVGIGTDFDGGGEVEGCFDVSEMTNITIELVNRGYSKEEIRKIWGGNFLRVLRDVEDAAGNRSFRNSH